MKQQAAQVYFPKGRYLEIKMIAKNRNKSIAGWLRDLADREVKLEKKKKKTFRDWPTFSRKVDDPYLSEHLDDIIYDNA